MSAAIKQLAYFKRKSLASGAKGSERATRSAIQLLFASPGTSANRFRPLVENATTQGFSEHPA
jgi:hypothetical protein